MKLPPLGMDSLLDFQKGNLYYVDKTPFIKTVIESSASAHLRTFWRIERTGVPFPLRKKA